MKTLSLDLPSLQAAYATGALTPRDMIELLLERTSGEDAHHVWIYRLSEETLFANADALTMGDAKTMPLYGIPFAIKDNIDLAGVPTTAGCPAYARTPERSATVVQRLLDAGAMPIGKTNLDQFATGLNGTRSPFGACRNAFNPDYIAGGSSSGSAVAVAKGWASFSLGTDTAGSGRVPAAFNNLIGLKPTRGIISTQGVVPACRSLDVVSIFSLAAADAEAILSVAAGYDAADVYSRALRGHGFDFGRAKHFRFAIPRACDLQFFDNAESEQLFRDCVRRLETLGGTAVEIDFKPFLETARLLYEGPWVAERFAALKDFLALHEADVHDAVRAIVMGAKRFSAADAFMGEYRLEALKRETSAIWSEVDCLVTPTAGTIYTVAEMLRDPIALNATLGYYTNFMNLLDYAAVAVPAGFQRNGLPFGITLGAPAFQDAPLLHLASRLHRSFETRMDAMEFSLPDDRTIDDALPSGWINVAVCGAHLSGLPLNEQLTTRGARLVTRTTTSPDYKLYALPDGPPWRPGLERVGEGAQGASIEVEIWQLPASEFGSFVAGIPAPLGIGRITLASGEQVQGFLCEHYALNDATDITLTGGWRNYLAAATSRLG